jgi:hypothetical protein
VNTRDRPPDDEGPQRGPTSKAATTPHTDKWNHTASRRRLIAAARCEPHEWSGYRDPLCDAPKPELTVDSYAQAARHLLDHGLCPHADQTALQALWRRQGQHRRLAQQIVELWDGQVA